MTPAAGIVTAKMADSRKPLVPALERGLAIVEMLAKSRSGLTLSQLTRYLELPKSSVFCLLRTLEAAGYVYREAELGKYRISLRVCSLAHMALGGIPLREIARPYLRCLSESTGLTVHMAVLEQGTCTLIEKMSRPEVKPVATWVGKHLSLHCTALGKALSAYIPDEELQTLIREQGLLRHNDNTICSLKRLRTELAHVRERGYAIDDEEEEIGVRCIGVPVLNSRREALAAVSLVATTTQLHAENLQSLAGTLIGVAKDISGQVVHQGTEAQFGG
ncbi:MAG TPA: IclR family transcriptional regulator [Bryobacteraceae bacterium]|nr:IclR family transcriptional regulator [Bryobacteraceae bacterium]